MTSAASPCRAAFFRLEYVLASPTELWSRILGHNQSPMLRVAMKRVADTRLFSLLGNSRVQSTLLRELRAQALTDMTVDRLQLIADELAETITFGTRIGQLRDQQIEQQATIVLVSDAPYPVAAALAKRFGAAHALAPQMVTNTRAENVFVDAGTNASLTSSDLLRWSASQNVSLTDSSAYFARASDVPLFRHVGHLCAFEPDNELARSARAQGWPMLFAESPRIAFSTAPTTTQSKTRQTLHGQGAV